MAEAVATFFLDSFKRGGILATLNVSDYTNLGDLLQKEHIEASNVVIEFKDKDGNIKTTENATAFTEGDTVRIANKSNKSG
jgi:hypothetical protein